MTPEELREALAANIRTFARKKKLSLNKLADLAGISRPTMYYLLSARSSVGVDTIAKLADALGQAPAALLTKTDQPRRRKAKA